MAIDQHLHRFSTDEYETIVSSGALQHRHVELLDGLLVDMSPQDEPHWRVIQNLIALCTPRVRLLRVQAPLAVADGWVPEPDIALAEHDPDPRIRPQGAHLVVEIAFSSRYRDLRKAGVYARAGVARYWIVDADRDVVIEHRNPTPDGYADVTLLTSDDVLDTGVEGIPTTTVAALFDI